MRIRFVTIKALFWFCAIVLLVLSFPLQVLTNSPYPALLPYFVIAPVVLPGFLFSGGRTSTDTFLSKNRNVNLMVRVYFFLVLFHTTWQTVFQMIGLNEAVSVLVVYLFPAVFYLYFRDSASEREIRWVLWAIVVGALISGLYFVYDSYMKLALGQVSNYTYAAFEYSIARSGQEFGEANTARIHPGLRSYGLLQTHSVSGAWVVLGAFAALALIPSKRVYLRRFCISVFSIMLLIALNFTSIIAFVFIIIAVELGGWRLLSGRIRTKTVSSLIVLSVVLVGVAGTVFYVVGDVMAETMQFYFLLQKDIIFSAAGGEDISMSGMLMGSAHSYFRYISESPLVFLFGDGFSAYGFPKGGDMGFVETLAQFGLPFYLCIMLGLLSLVRAGVRAAKASRVSYVKGAAQLDRSHLIQFTACVTLLIVIMDIHYSIWAAKPVLPIFFFALAIYGRYNIPPSNA